MRSLILVVLTFFAIPSSWSSSENLGQVRKVALKDQVRLEISLHSGPYLIITDRSLMLEQKAQEGNPQALNDLIEQLKKPYTGWHPEQLDLDFRDTANTILETHIKEGCDNLSLLKKIEDSFGQTPAAAEIDVTFKTSQEKQCLFK